VVSMPSCGDHALSVPKRDTGGLGRKARLRLEADL